MDTGVILPFCYIDFPISKEKIIEALLNDFDIFIPKNVEDEMQRPKPHLERQWDEISYIWSQIRRKINREDPPESCFNIVSNKIPSREVEVTDRKVLSLGLYLSRLYRRPIFLLTHERKAFQWFNFISREQQLGYVFSPFDIIAFMRLYLSLPYKETDYDCVWRELYQFTGIPNLLVFRQIEYGPTLSLCLQHCETQECMKKKGL